MVAAILARLAAWFALNKARIVLIGLFIAAVVAAYLGVRGSWIERGRARERERARDLRDRRHQKMRDAPTPDSIDDVIERLEKGE